MTGAEPRGLAALAVRNATFGAFGRVTGIVVGLVLTPFVLGGLGRELYGVLSAAGSAFDYLTLLRGGMGSAMRRHVTIRVQSKRPEEARGHYAAGFWWGLILRIPILAAGLLIAEPLCRMLNLDPEVVPRAAEGVRLLVVSAVLADMAGVFEVPIYATGNTALLGAVRTLSTLLRLGIVLAAFRIFSASLRSYGGAMITVEAIVLLFLVYLAWRSRTVGPPVPRPTIGSPAVRKELFRYGSVAILAQIAALMWLTTDNLLIGHFYGAAAVTTYSLGARWLPLVKGLMSSMTSSLIPLFTKLEAQAARERTQAAAIRAVSATSALAVPACLVPCVVGDLFLHHWVGPEYAAAYPILVVTLAPLVIDLAFSPIWSVLQARGRIGWVATAEILVAVANVALSLLLALGFGLGILGFALGNTLAILLRSLVLRPIQARREPALPPLRALVGPIVRALAGGLPGLGLLYLTRGVYGGSLFGVIAASIAGGAIVLAGSAGLALRPSGMRALRSAALRRSDRP